MKVFFWGALALVFCQAASRPKSTPTPAEAPNDDAATVSAKAAPPNRVVSVLIAQDIINETIAKYSKSNLIKKFEVDFDPDNTQIYFRGILRIPVEELRALNLDPDNGNFRFQLTVKPEISKHGHLILDFPLSETFFYPANSKDPKHERVIIPTQLLSIALASARGYLAALSGDFSGFDKREKTIQGTIDALQDEASREKNADVRDSLNNQKESLKLQLAAIPLERKQLQAVAKSVEHLMGFTGEKELNLNNELGARKNALILKVKLSQLAPFLDGVELGGVRIVHDKKDGNGENFLAIDVNADLVEPPSDFKPQPHAPRPAMHVAPSLILKLNQSLFKSEAVVAEEKQKMPSKLKHFDVHFQEDGIHVMGGWRTLLIFTIPFETVVNVNYTGLDTFEVHVEDIKVAGIDVEFLSKYILESMKTRLDLMLKGHCGFDFIPAANGQPPGLKVSIVKPLVPAFPQLHLVGATVRDREFLLKIGRP